MDELPLVVSDPAILGGAPVVRGTRVAVAILLARHAGGTSEAELLQEFPDLTPGVLRDVLALPAESLRSIAARDPLAPAFARGEQRKTELAARADLVGIEEYAGLLGWSPEAVREADARGELLGVTWRGERLYPRAFVRQGLLPLHLSDVLRALRGTIDGGSEWAQLDLMLAPWPPTDQSLLEYLWAGDAAGALEAIAGWVTMPDEAAAAEAVLADFDLQRLEGEVAGLRRELELAALGADPSGRTEATRRDWQRRLTWLERLARRLRWGHAGDASSERS